MADEPMEIMLGLCTKCAKPFTADDPKGDYMGVAMHESCIKEINNIETFGSTAGIGEAPPKTKPLQLPARAAPSKRGRPRGTQGQPDLPIEGEDDHWRSLTDQQLLNIEVYSTLLNQADIAINPKEVFEHWNTDPDQEYRSGKRPNMRAIESYMASKQYAGNMEQRGVTNHSSLTVEQTLVLQTITDVRDTRPISKKLSAHKVSRAKYNQWLRNPEFAKLVRKLSDTALKDSIHHGKVALAQKAESGDLNAIKYLYELTGTYNPNDSNKVADNLQQLIQIILEVVASQVNDPEILNNIQTQIAMRSNALRGGGSITRAMDLGEIE